MSEHPLQATVSDVVPLGSRLLLSVRGLSRRPSLPNTARIVQTGEELRLLDLPASPTMWLLSEVTLLAEPMLAEPLGTADWRGWKGKTLLIGDP